MLRDCSDIEVVVPVVINVLDYLQSGFAGSVCMKASKFPRPRTTARLTGCNCFYTDQVSPCRVVSQFVDCSGGSLDCKCTTCDQDTR